MHKDPNLRKRNALVIPGGLLALYGFLGVLYVVAVRGDDGSCGDAALIVFLGACRSALLVLAIPIIIGLAMVAVGALAFRNRASCRAGHGSWTHFGLAFLISLTLIPLLAMLLSPSLVGADAVITRGTVDYPLSTVLAGLTGIGLLMLVPFVVLYAAQARANPCCQEKGCFDPCFCDETLTAEPPAAALPEESAPAPALVAVPEPPAPAPEPVPAPPAPAEPAAPPAGDQWEVIPEEPKAEPEPARQDALATPPLATLPTDPAAPPADAMAVAAKWAEEDEEALEELEVEPASRSGGRRKPAAKPSKKKATVKATKASKPKKKR